MAIVAKGKVSGALEEGIPSTEVIEAVEEKSSDIPAIETEPSVENEIPQQ